MRITHVICTDAFAGVERHVANLAGAEAAAGHDVTVLGGDPSRMPQVAGASVRHVPLRTVPEATCWLLRNTASIEVIAAHLTAAELAGLLGAALRRPVVATRHIGAVRGSTRGGRAAAGIIRRGIAAQIAPSHFVAERIDGESIVVPSGVPVAQVDPSVPRERTVLLAQRHEPEKGSDVAVRALLESGLVAEGWRLVVAGSGSLLPQLRELAAAAPAGSVIFTGQLADLGEALSTAGLLLAPCPREAFGLSVVEAMAHALPTVAAGAGGHLETVGRSSMAALFDPGDAADAARQLRRLADDPSAREAYGVDLQRIQRAEFTLERQQERTEAVYRSVVR